MNEPRLETFAVNGIRMRVAIQGEGPLVIFCHGFPECWVSWRRQLQAVSAAGFRAVAPDMRGYGGSDAPADPDQYTMLHHVGDMVELVHALGESQAVIVGHDWGAPVAWHAALLRPQVFRAVVGLSVPYSPPADIDLLSALEKRGVHTFYMQYFQAPGVAEAELEADVAATLRKVTWGLSGEGAGGVPGLLGPGAGFLENAPDPARMPDWLDAADFEHAVGEFRRNGFRGPLNWYRAIRKSHELLTAWRGAAIGQPALFIGGEKDDVLKFSSSRSGLAQHAETLPGLRGNHILEGAGHWIQREKAEAVNSLILEFLGSLR